MRTILCFGDSNTYGESPEGFGRYERHERWTGRLQAALGEGYLVIEEGLNGRTTVWEDPVEGDKCGKKHLPVCLETHAPLDLVILMLGTNDLKARFSATPTDVAKGAEALLRMILRADNGRRAQPPKVLLVSPIHLRATTFLGEVFGDRRADSMRLAALYAAAAERNGAAYMDAAQFAQASTLDGLHLDRDGHASLAAAFENEIRQIFC